MSEEIIEDMLEEVAPQVAGDYPEIAQRYKAGEELTDEELQKGINERTRLVAVTQVSNVLGCVNPIQKITEMAHRVGAVVVVDGAQSVPHMPVDVQALDADFLAFSGHKLMGPMGIGCLYGKRELLEKMPPFLTGGEMIDSVYRDGSGICRKKDLIISRKKSWN